MNATVGELQHNGQKTTEPTGGDGDGSHMISQSELSQTTLVVLI